MRHSEYTKVDQVISTVKQRIQRRGLVPGAMLPSVRQMAQSTAFSKSTIVEAYERLVAEGVVRSRPGAGFYVAAPLAPLSIAETEPQLDPVIDPLWMLRQSLHLRPDALKPGCGWLPESWMEDELVRKGLRALARGEASRLVGYDSAMGSESLRTIIARRLGDQGVDAAPDQVLLTDSGTHAIDLVCRFLIETGDAVLVDDPCYFNFHSLLRAHRAKVVAVPYSASGPDVVAFAQILAEHRPRLYITNSAVHNPTGANLSATTAHRVLKLAEAHDLIIVEDDIFSDFEVTPTPTLAAYDGLDRVIRVGSFSKSLSSAVRCGHIAARRDWIAALTDMRIATGMSGSALSAELLRSVLTDGTYRRHMEKVRRRLAEARSVVLRRLGEIGITPWIQPEAGLFLWCRLPNDANAAEVARRAMAEQIFLAPGNAFSIARSAACFLRFNVAMMDNEKIYRTLKRLCAEVGQSPTRSTATA
jgi:DNA-binding transcriptional MocR family regulator